MMSEYTQQTISIPIINDIVRENRETLTVRLTNAPDRVSLAPDKAWISIVDNDRESHIITCTLQAFTSNSPPQVL